MRAAVPLGRLLNCLRHALGSLGTLIDFGGSLILGNVEGGYNLLLSLRCDRELLLVVEGLAELPAQVLDLPMTLPEIDFTVSEPLFDRAKRVF